MRANPISATVAYDQDGVQHGHLKVPYSGDDSAWGAVMIPITVVRNGDGPVALFTGGNHGDEYEGPIALWQMTSELAAEKITGSVIIVPAMNYPAFQAGKRTSSIDGGNMNRVFPGDPNGTITEIIADYFSRTLLPLADYVVDVHSGGKTLDFVPFAAAHILEDKEQEARCVAAMRAFNAPWSVMLLELDAAHMYDTAAESQGKVFVSTELGGGGSANPESVAIARRGLNNVMVHAGILKGEVTAEPSNNIDMPDSRCFITSEHSGLLDMQVGLGDPVREGQVVAKVYDIERTGKAPEQYRAAIDGVLVGRHYPCLTKPGDNLAVIGVPV